MKRKEKLSFTNLSGIPVHHREYFLAVPNEIIRFLFLFSGNEFKVLLYLLITRNLKDKNYGQVKEIAAHTGFHTNTVYTILKSLEKLGLIQSRRDKSGSSVFINYFKDLSFKKVFDEVRENVSSGKTKVFSGIRYLYYKNEEKKDFSNSTFIDNFFSSFLVRIPGTENSYSLDTKDRSCFQHLTGNHLKLLVYFKYLSQFKDCEFFKASYFRIEKATGIKHTTISKLLNELCDEYQFLGRECYGKNKKRYFFNYNINGVSTSEKRAAEKARAVLTKTEVQKDLISQKTDFLSTKQISTIIKDICETKNSEISRTVKEPETRLEPDIKISSRVEELKEQHRQKYVIEKTHERSNDIDFNFLEELNRLKGRSRQYSSVCEKQV